MCSIYGVRVSVCPQHAGAAGLLLWAQRAGDIDIGRLLQGRRSLAAAAARRAATGCEQCHVVS